MGPLTLLRAGFVISAVALSCLGAYAYTSAIDHAREVAYSRDLRQLKVLDARLNEEVLRSRSGLVSHYDGLVHNLSELRRLLPLLRQVPHFLEPQGAADLRQRLDALGVLLSRKNQLVEGFKSHNAVLRNSQRMVPVATRMLHGEPLDPILNRRIDALLSALLPLDMVRDQEVRAELETEIRNLDELGSHQHAVLPEGLRVLLRHARVVSVRKPIVDGVLRQILAVPLGSAASGLEGAYSRHYRAALDAVTLRQQALFGLATALIALGLTDVIFRLRQGARALQHATEELRGANRALGLEREKERELGQLKTRFVSMTSHEFRSPLSVILSSSELLSTYGERWNADRRLDHLGRIQHAARSMSQLLDEILLIGRAEAGMLQPTPAPVNLDELCRELIETLQQTSGNSHAIGLKVNGDVNVVLDERLLRHFLSNLLENAIKYSAPGSSVELDVSVLSGQVRFVVRDNGIGIPNEDVPALFTSFRRGGNVGQIQGSGLGLSVVKHVVDAQSGKIHVKSAVGQGTEFVVVLPSETLRHASGGGA